MAFDREREIVARHAAAVVGDADAPPPAAIGEDIDAARAGIDGIFHEFLDGARGPLDHFAGGDAVDDGSGSWRTGMGGSLGRYFSRFQFGALYGRMAANACPKSGNRCIFGKLPNRHLETVLPPSGSSVLQCSIVAPGDRVYRLEKL